MNVTITLNISQQEFFDYLTQSLMIDIFKNTDEFKSEEEIKKGLIYEKKLKDSNGKEVNVQIEILEYVILSLYKSRVRVGSNSTEIIYECKPIDEKQVLVTYTESFNSSKKLNVLNHKFMSFLLSRTSKKKMKRMLMAMENHIQRSKYE